LGGRKGRHIDTSAWLIIGALAGWIASLITGRGEGLLLDIVVGIIGAFVGGLLYSALTGVNFTAGFNLTTLMVAIVGAVILLMIWGAVRARRVF
jgi:uncharacterized membrane protein YeaQ/YmgE (transglycosylase-associated protein family)